MERVDIAVVGGGPAGAMAAREAASRGADVLLLERGVPRADREELGPDSTDAAGMLDYWVDILGVPFEEIPDDVVLQKLEGTEFIGPNERCTLRSTGMDASYDGFGFTFQRARMDDWLRTRAEEAGAEYRVGTNVRSVETTLGDGHSHTLTLGDGSTVEAEYLLCTDGPQRTVTIPVLDQFLPDGQSIGDVIGPRTANHIAYQEHRHFPEELFEPTMLKFWWGHIPGKTAYPWVFPNDGTVARVGLTMPIGMDLSSVENREDYPLVHPDDEQVPSGSVYLRRLLELEYGDEYDVDADFPLVEDRGKRGGTEAYPISSTRPIDSPTAAGVAVAGGAMGTTSAFHEGGYHVAARSGAIAGRLAATGQLSRYNYEWRQAIGDELLRNVAMADLVDGYGPADWDRTFRTVRRMLANDDPGVLSMLEPRDGLVNRKFTAGIGALSLIARYRWIKYQHRNDGYVQFRESEYVY